MNKPQFDIRPGKTMTVVDGIIFLGAVEGLFARGDVLSMISIMLRTKIESDTMIVCLFT